MTKFRTVRTVVESMVVEVDIVGTGIASSVGLLLHNVPNFLRGDPESPDAASKTNVNFVNTASSLFKMETLKCTKISTSPCFRAFCS